MMKQIKVGIIGSRRRDSLEDFKCLVDFILPHFEHYNKEGYEIVLVSGGCKQGGDRFAEILRDEFNLNMIIHYPNKNDLPDEPKRKDFRKINYTRNILIAKNSDVLYAVVASDRKGGTEHTIREFKKINPKGKVYIL